MKIQIQAPDSKRFDLILRTVNAQLSLWTQNPQFSCRPVVKGDDITLIGYGKNADKDRWFESFARGIVDYLKPKHAIEATVEDDVMKFELLYVVDEKEEDKPNADNAADKAGNHRRKARPKKGD